MATIAMGLALAGGTATAAKLLTGKNIRDGSIKRADLAADAAVKTFQLDGAGNDNLDATDKVVIGPLTIGPTQAGVNVLTVSLSVFQRIDVPTESNSLVLCELRVNDKAVGAGRVGLVSDADPAAPPNAEQAIYIQARAPLARGNRVTVTCKDTESETRVASVVRPRLILRRGGA